MERGHESCGGANTPAGRNFVGRGLNFFYFSLAQSLDSHESFAGHLQDPRHRMHASVFQAVDLVGCNAHLLQLQSDQNTHDI